MDEMVLHAALAGLLHDVGKLEQRARSDPWKSAPDVKLEDLPTHATWSAYFAQQYLPDRYKSIGLHAAYHHTPETSPAERRALSELVALADKLSSGEPSDPTKDYPSSNPPQQMVTVFDRLTLNGQGVRAENYVPLTPLALDPSVLFPQQAQLNNSQSRAYEELRSGLEQAAQQDSPDMETYIENLLVAMQRTTWCVPSAFYHSVPDVSLYDHSRMTAALAVCLTEFEPEGVRDLLKAVSAEFQQPPDEKHSNPMLEKSIALLIGGDISGVQDFIYTLSSKGAAQTLRGRSFYLQLLTEAVLRYVLRELGLPYANVIYSGGGHFYLLAPLRAARRLREIRTYVTTTLLDHHGSALYLALDGVEVPSSGFRVGHFPQHWGQVHGALARAKQRRYAELDDELLATVFAPQAHGGNREDTCSVCGEEDARAKVLGEPDDPNAKICRLCSSFAEQIGAKLPNTKFVSLGFHAPRQTEKGNALDALRAFGMEVSFASSVSEAISFPEEVQRAVVWALDDTRQWPNVPGVPTAQVTRYTVNLVPPMTFDKLQTQARGIDRLGVLRMDVDSLGDLFKDGFGRGEISRASLARISTLSFQLSLFFEGWVKRLCESYGNLIYAVYAGGDDMFLIGPWDRMPELAIQIAKDFRRYAGDNPAVHVSGGMAFIHGKYPVYQAADDARDALDQAKDVEGKDAFSFLGQAWKWSEFEQIVGKFRRLEKLVGDAEAGGLEGPQAVLQVLRQLARDEADKAKRLKGRPVWGPWMWKGAYLLTRMAERARSRNQALHDELIAIRDDLSKNDYSEIGQWGAAARWVELRQRKKETL